jgi:PAS domain S-box-containing protein
MLLEALHRTKNGVVFPVEISARRITVQGVRYVQCIVRDISERKQAQEKILQLNQELELRVQERTEALERANGQLRAEITDKERTRESLIISEQALRTIFNSVFDAIFIHTIDGTIIDVNTKVLELYHLTREEALGYSLGNEFLSGNNQTVDLPTMWAKAAAGDKQLFEWEARLPKEGTLFAAESFVCPIILNGNNYLLTTVRDVRERKCAEREALQSRLVQSSKMESLGQLAAGVAHELNNPLTVIMGNMQYLIGQEGFDDSSRGIFSEIENAAQRCRKIVADLLEFAKKKEVTFETCSLNNLLDRVLHLSEYQTGFKQLQIEKQYDEHLPLAKVSMAHMEQVFLNLLSNAAQAMQGSGVLTVRTRVVPGKQMLEVAVKDTGEGISPEKIVRIFEPFYTTKTKGTGLGLAVSYSIVKQHGGDLTAFSAGTGQGSVFTVTIPY